MERKKYLVVILLWWFIPLEAQYPVYKEKIYHAFVKGDMSRWRSVMMEMELDPVYKSNTSFELIDYYYGYIAWCLGNKKKSEAEVYLNKANALLKNVEKLNSNNQSTIKAYKAAFIGFQIGISPYKAPVLGGKSQQMATEALSYNDSNPLAYIEQGNIFFYSPSIFGGSKSKAIENYVKAIAIFESEPEKLKLNWRYLNTMVSLLNAYNKTNQTDNAAALKKKIYVAEPNFEWIKEF